MGILNLIKSAPERSAGDALAAHDERHAAVHTELTRLSELDSAAHAGVEAERVAAEMLAVAERRVYAVEASKNLGTATAADVAAAEADRDTVAAEHAKLVRRAHVAAQERAQLAPGLKKQRTELEALDAARPDLERAAEHEAAIAELAEYRRTQGAFIECWLRLHSRALRMDQVRVVGAPLGSAVAVRDLVLPLPRLPEVKVAELDRQDLFARLTDLAKIPAEALRTK
jgi:hypothetical protein